MREVRLIWAMVGATLAALVVTYSRLPAGELYNVSHSGVRAALGRAVVDLNFPDSLIALAVLGVVARGCPAVRGGWPSQPPCSVRSAPRSSARPISTRAG